MIKLTKKQIIDIHQRLISSAGGTEGVRDEGLLESALNSPFQTFGGAELYPSLLQKAAQLGFAVVANHPFIDGNKRTGIHIMLVFLALNGVELNYSQEELIDVGLRLAAGEIRTPELTKWLHEHN